MTFEDRVKAVGEFGFTEKQAGFLVLVLLYSGVCLGRQYCSYSRIGRGQNMYNFFSDLTAREFATAYPHAQSGTHVYHVHSKPLYQAVGEPDSRHRKPVTLGRAIERLMALDAVVAAPEVTWLATQHEKVGYFTRVTNVRREELPRLTFGESPQTATQFFPDKLPIGITSDGRGHLFLYIVTRQLPIDFRAFLQRHAALFRALPSWAMRLVVPKHLAQSQSLYQRAVQEELAMPLRPTVRDELRWFFERRRNLSEGSAVPSDLRFQRAQRAFGAPRFRRLYRSWLEQGDGVIEATVSPVLADAFARRSARVECHVFRHNYRHLEELVGTA